MKILIVDDSLTIRTLLKSLLFQAATEGCSKYGTLDVFEADTGNKGLEAFAQLTPDVVFLDIHMPEKDGISVLQDLKATATGPQTPVVMVSSETDPRQINRCKDYGAFGFIKKPFKPNSIKAALYAALQFRYPNA